MRVAKLVCPPVKCGIVLAVMLFWSAPSLAFNPQPEPPGGYVVQGYMDLSVTAADPADTSMPFGILPEIVNDGVVDFSAAVIGHFSVPTPGRGAPPADGIYDGSFEFFHLSIDGTSWDHMLPGTPPQFQVVNGLVTGMKFTITVTLPSHPDLVVNLATPYGTWYAVDEVDGVNLGTIAGDYSLRDGVVPEPQAAALVVLLALAGCRRRR